MPIGLGLINDYIDDEVKQMIEKNTQIEKNQASSNVKPKNDTQPGDDSLNVNTGHLCWCILFYLFSPYIIDLVALPKTRLNHSNIKKKPIN